MDLINQGISFDDLERSQERDEALDEAARTGQSIPSLVQYGEPIVYIQQIGEDGQFPEHLQAEVIDVGSSERPALPQ